jgi:uncharacterized protein
MTAMLRECDLILHAGDFTSRAAYDEIRALGPLQAVYGNADTLDLRLELPKRLRISAEGILIGLVHGDGLSGTTVQRARRGFAEAPAVRCVVFGHQHCPYCETDDGVLLFSPGSPTDPRRAPQPSFGILHVTGDQVRGEIVWL